VNETGPNQQWSPKVSMTKQGSVPKRLPTSVFAHGIDHWRRIAPRPLICSGFEMTVWSLAVQGRQDPLRRRSAQGTIEQTMVNRLFERQAHWLIVRTLRTTLIRRGSRRVQRELGILGKVLATSIPIPFRVLCRTVRRAYVRDLAEGGGIVIKLFARI